MGREDLSVESLPVFRAKSPEDIEWLWSATLPASRDSHPAVWDSMMGFFEDAIVACSSRPGKLVVTPRELLKQLKHNGREPASGMKIITELFKRGDIVRADTLKAPTTSTSAPSSSYSLSGLRSALSGYIWGSGAKKAETLEADEAIVPVAALKAAAERAGALSGPVASADIHTAKSLAAAVTGDSVRDAEAVIAHLVARGDAAAVFTDASKEHPAPVMGVKLGRAAAVVDADKGVLRTKAALESMQDMAAHLEEGVEAERVAATAAAKAGDKKEALARLRKKKALETKLASSRSAASKLGDVLMAVDEAESNREAVLALETGMESLKLATEDGVTADRVDSVAADFEEMMAEQKDVRMALEQINSDAAATDAELEAELDELIDDSAKADAAADAKKAQEAASTGLSAEDKAAEEELARIMAELPMPAAVGAAVGTATGGGTTGRLEADGKADAADADADAGRVDAAVG